MSELIPITHLVEFNFSSPLYHHFPIQLKLLQQIATSSTNQDELVATNTLRITCCTAFIESILFESLIAVISAKRNGQSDELILRILAQKESQISAGTFKDFQRVSDECLGKKLSKYTSSHLWEDITILFALRNQIIHGKHFSVKYVYSDDAFQGTPEKNYADIIKFLKKRKLIDEDYMHMSQIFRNDIVEFFISATKQFFVDITKEISEEFKTSTFEGFQHIRKSLDIT